MDTHEWSKSAAGSSRPACNSGEAAGLAPTSRLPSRETTRADYIAYMADMIHEMRVLAERTGCPTLAGILHLAHSEALRDAARR